MTGIEEAKVVYGEKLNAPEIIQDADAIFLGDASAATPNIRASEPVFHARFLREVGNVPIITSVYTGGPIGKAIEHTPYTLIEGQTDGVLLTIDNELLEDGYKQLFGDPQEWIISKRRRIEQEEAVSRESGHVKIRRYISALPATIFSDCERIPYIRRLQNERRCLVETFAENSSGDDLIQVELATDYLKNITLRDILRGIDPKEAALYETRVAAHWTCPHCSLNGKPGDEFIEHAMNFNGEVFRTQEMIPQRGKPWQAGCPPMKHLVGALKSGSSSLLDIPIETLINAGFKFSGKMIYLMERTIYANPFVVQAVREYSDPRGTIELAMRQWPGTDILTPRVYIRVTEEDGSVRDATGYELAMFFNENSGNADLVRNFRDGIPLYADEKVYVLDLTKRTISVN